MCIIDDGSPSKNKRKKHRWRLVLRNSWRLKVESAPCCMKLWLYFSYFRPHSLNFLDLLFPPFFAKSSIWRKIPADVNPRKACPHTVFWSLKRPILPCSTNQARRKLTERPARFLPYLVPLAWNGLYWFPIQVGIAPRKPTEIPEQRGQSRLSLFLSFISFVLLDRTVSSRTAWFGDWCSSKLLYLIDSLIKRMKTCSA